jgi:type III secretory pathway component EscV
MIQSYINKEIKEINSKVEKTIDDLNNRRISSATMNQQYIMTSVNNLALLLDESMQQMQQQMATMSGGKGSMASCPSPGAGKMSISTLRQLQEQMNKQLEQLKQGMGSQKNGGNQGNQSISEQLARLAAEQEAIRNQMQNYMESLKEQGIDVDGATRQLLNDMEKTETELVNKIITNQTLLRQQQILTRLLQSEKAELMREQEEKRESKEAKDQKISNPEDFFKYKSIKSQQVELLKTIPPSFKPFYKKKVNEYLYNFELQ